MSRDDPPPGWDYAAGRERYDAPNLVVPLHVRKQIVDQEKLLDSAQREQEEMSRRSQENGVAAAQERINKRIANLRQREKDAEQLTESEKSQWDVIEERDRMVAESSKIQVKIFSAKDAAQLDGRAGDKDDSERFQRHHDALLKIGTTLRTMARPSSTLGLSKLLESQPHFKEVTEFFLTQLALQKKSRNPIRFQPVLLVGPPGIGKTHFVQALAVALETTSHIERMDSDVISSFLLGSSAHWGNSKNGLLFDLLALGKFANPNVVLDELDKARYTTYGSAMGALYSVLEPVSAKSVRDVSLGFELNASFVTYIATANDSRLIDAPLRSRFREFCIQPPTAEDALVLAREVMHSTIKGAGIRGFSDDGRLSKHLAHLTAREIYQLTLDAVSKAVAKGRNRLEKEDLPPELIGDEGIKRQANMRMH